MAELYQQEKLQPSLLDRLTDDTLVEIISTGHGQNPDVDPGLAESAANVEPSTTVAPENSSSRSVADRFIISSRKLRELVMRDLAWLLNTSSLEATYDLSGFPLSAASVINYGAPSLTGVTLGNLDTRMLERRLKAAILHFEPRVLKNTLSVKIGKKDSMSSRALTFEIECDIWGQPAPEHLLMDSVVDLETGAFSFTGMPGNRGAM